MLTVNRMFLRNKKRRGYIESASLLCSINQALGIYQVFTTRHDPLVCAFHSFSAVNESYASINSLSISFLYVTSKIKGDFVFFAFKDLENRLRFSKEDRYHSNTFVMIHNIRIRMIYRVFNNNTNNYYTYIIEISN